MARPATSDRRFSAAAAAAATTTSSPSLRFLGLLKQPEDTNSDQELELDERDVVWSSSSSSSSSSATSSPSPSGGLLRPLSRPFRPGSIGLSALLADESAPTTAAIPAAARPETQPPEPYHQSAPVAVPAWPKGMERRRRGAEEVEEEAEAEEEEEAVVPPHEMAARRAAAAASVMEGAGRTLKGRDLRRVRNAVWRTTGFLDL